MRRWGITVSITIRQRWTIRSGRPIRSSSGTSIRPTSFLAKRNLAPYGPAQINCRAKQLMARSSTSFTFTGSRSSFDLVDNHAAATSRREPLLHGPARLR